MVSDNLLQTAAEFYGFDREKCSFITYGRERKKQIYRFNMNGNGYILRFLKMPEAYIGRTRAEMDWLSYLARKGGKVPKPLKTKNGEFAFSVDDEGESYILSAFSMAEGQHWDKDNPQLWNKDIFYRWGRVVADIHRLTKDYCPPDEQDRVEVFQISSMISENIKSFPEVNKITETLMKEIEALPKDKESYGLIHNDLHPWNFLIEGKDIHLFDFDNCAYSWYILDIATALYLALWFGRSNHTGVDFTNDIIRYFIQGYQQVNPLNDFWLSKIPLFMMACKIALFSLGVDSENPGGQYNNKQRMEQMHNIENNIFFSGSIIDFSLFGSNF